MTAALAPLRELVKDFPSTHVMLVHHGRKSGGNNAYLGSTAFHGLVDAAIDIKVSQNGQRFMEADPQRYGAQLPKTELVLDPTTGRLIPPIQNGPATPGGPRPGDADAGTQAKIFRALQVGPLGLEPLRDRVGIRNATLRPLLDELVAAGKVVRRGTRKRGDPLVFSLAAEVSAPGGHTVEPGPKGTPGTDREAGTVQAGPNVGREDRTEPRTAVPTPEPARRKRSLSSPTPLPASGPLADPTAAGDPDEEFRAFLRSIKVPPWQLEQIYPEEAMA